MSHLLSDAILVSVLAATVRIATPLILAALGELIIEKAGILNLGVEGMMLMGAFSAFAFAFVSGSALVGLFAAIVAGGLMAFILVLMAVTLKIEQIICGLVLNMVAAGLSFFIYNLSFEGQLLSPNQIFENAHIPILSEIPYLGPILFQQKFLTYVAFALVPIIWFFLYRTKYGLEIRCLGENPKVIDTRGLSVTLRQYAAVIAGGMLIGLGGAFVTIASTVRFVPDITAGRGWLALVIVIAANWRPVGVFIAALVFACLEALQLQFQGIGIPLPYQLFLALPYVAAILLMVIKRRQSEVPSRLGLPYFQGER